MEDGAGAGWREDDVEVEATVRAGSGGQMAAVAVDDGPDDGEAQAVAAAPAPPSS